MPFKDDKAKTEYQRDYMRRYRAADKATPQPRPATTKAELIRQLKQANARIRDLEAMLSRQKTKPPAPKPSPEPKAPLLLKSRKSGEHHKRQSVRAAVEQLFQSRSGLHDLMQSEHYLLILDAFEAQWEDLSRCIALSREGIPTDSYKGVIKHIHPDGRHPDPKRDEACAMLNAVKDQIFSKEARKYRKGHISLDDMTLEEMKLRRRPRRR
jgi:hypothetical protein